MNGLDAAQLALLSDLLERRQAELIGHQDTDMQGGGRDLAV
jgi:hypothetical protein